MKLNKKVRYGLRTMIEIASNQNSVLLQKEIAQRQKIPLKFLDTIITGLKAEGLIRNYKGKKSGYVLSKLPEEISVYDIYRAFEPELEIVECLCEPEICELNINCKAREHWNSLNKLLQNSFKEKLLKDFIT